MHLAYSLRINKNASACRIFLIEKIQQNFNRVLIKNSGRFNMKIAIAVPELHSKIHGGSFTVPQGTSMWFMISLILPGRFSQTFLFALV